jgi:uncharacterized C2H2 Zn-finger protein
MKWMVNKMEFIECPVCNKDINYHKDYELKICYAHLIEENKKLKGTDYVIDLAESNKYLKKENEDLKMENNHLASKLIKIEQIINNLD